MNPFRLLQHARKIAEAAHFGQRDKGGAPYMQHVNYVSSCGKTNEEKIVGMLHDVLEDAPLLIDIRGLDLYFGTEITNAVVALTKIPGENYFDYIERVKANPIARRVKVYDLLNNLNRERWEDMPDEYFKSRKKAIDILEGFAG